MCAVALLAGLAGCSSVVAELPFGAPAPYTETGAELNGTDLRADHVAGLEATEAFRSNASLVLSSDEHDVAIRRHVAVDRAADRRLQTSQFELSAIEGDGLVVSSYTEGNTTYRQVVIDAGQGTIHRYDTASEPYDDGLLAVHALNASEAAHADLVAAVVDEVTWTQRGVERYDGGWVTRYEASGAENASGAGTTALAAGNPERADLPESVAYDVTSVNATLLVSPDGVVRRFDLAIVGTSAGSPVELTLTVTTDGFGETDVEAPTWLGEVREQTDTRRSVR